MDRGIRQAFLEALGREFGGLAKLPGSQSLFDIAGGAARLYIRYSRLHGGQRTFYGLRREDLRRLEGRTSFVCFLWDGQSEPLLLPFADYEEVFQSVAPAPDGQYKVQVYVQPDATELYVATAGRFNMESHFGTHDLRAKLEAVGAERSPVLSHAQVQTILGAIGAAKGFDVWIPANDRLRMDWSVTREFECRTAIPEGYGSATAVLAEVDVLWIKRGSSNLTALFEVEHSTPVYSGLLRFNDVHLTAPHMRAHFNIVSNDARRSVFLRQLHRPTFRASGLSDLCGFMEYQNVFSWHRRITGALGNAS
jgi:hypothetical protein